MLQISLTDKSFVPPPSLLLPRLYFNVSSSAGLKKTSANFLDLLSDSKKLKSKRSPNPPLKYQDCKVFRIDEGFVAQTGDVTRQDGSGGESICRYLSSPWMNSGMRELNLASLLADGGTFNDEKEGLKTTFQLGTIAMANSGKNCEHLVLRF